MSKRHRRERQEGSDEGDGLWVVTEPDDHGGYIAVVSVNQDWSVRLDREAALRYSLACLESAARAEYDAAVFAQMTKKLQLSPPIAAKVLTDDLRPDRPPLDDAADGLRFEPGIVKEGRPFLTITLNGEGVGQLDPPRLREHAMFVLETPIVADLDAGYRRMLVGAIDLDEGRAANVIADLANYRWKFHG